MINQIFLLLILLISISGCKNSYSNHVEFYRLKHPDDFLKYSEFYQISIKATEKGDKFHKDDLNQILEIIENNKNDPEIIQQYINYWRELNSHNLYLSDISWWIDIKDNLKPGDTLCEYILEKDGEAGMVILRNGDIVFRKVTAGKPEKRNFDNR